MRRITFAALLLCFSTCSLYAQHVVRVMNVEKTDGSIVEYQVSELTRVFFEDKIVIEKETITANGVKFSMIKVEAGTFQMGSTSGESDEKPVHQVTLTKDYYIGETEVTQELWTAVMESNPSHFTDSDQLPVEFVSWDDCQEFIAKLNALTGKNFRLPTEAEWEFAARGGNASQGYTYSGSNTVSDVAWYYDNSGNKTHEVAMKAPNELGIYDMSGNVWEWCQDWYDGYSSEAQTDPTGPTSGSLRMFRGGGWNNFDIFCPVSNRCWNNPSNASNILGLRLVLSSAESTPSTDALAVDLGLPSGTKWADRNVGASKPEDYGGYYAWGETEEKEVYNWSTYIHCDGSFSTCHDIGTDIAGTQYDVAHVKWGGSWTMPTWDQVKELLGNCTSEWTTLNGVNGRKFTGPNGNSIFLPAAGYSWDDGLGNAGSYGGYWSSSLNESSPSHAYCLHFDSGGASWSYLLYRYGGRSVRPVR